MWVNSSMQTCASEDLMCPGGDHPNPSWKLTYAVWRNRWNWYIFLPQLVATTTQQQDMIHWLSVCENIRHFRYSPREQRADMVRCPKVSKWWVVSRAYYIPINFVNFSYRNLLTSISFNLYETLNNWARWTRDDETDTWPGSSFRGEVREGGYEKGK